MSATAEIEAVSFAPQEVRAVWPFLTPEERAEFVSLLSAEELEALGWRIWYEVVFGQAFVDALDSVETDDKHHSQAIEWHWKTRRALIQIELETGQLKKQLRSGVISQEFFDEKVTEFEVVRSELYLAYFTIWARGNLKTTIARRVAVCDACLSASAGVGGYALVIGGTKRKVRKTANAIDALLTKPPDMKGKGSNVYRYYPKLASVKRNKMGMSKGWTTDYINTEADYTFEFVGLDEGMAGANEEDIRPTFMLPDDIDNRKDSDVIAENNFQVFTTEILPMRQWNTLVFYAQNLISRIAVMCRIWKQHARVLTNRFMTDPIPAVRNLVTETKTVGGIVKDIYVSGKSTWRAWTPQRIQEEIDTMGLPAFLRECQHEVEQDREGLVLQHYNDSIHVISKSQFAFVYGTREKPQKWNKRVFNDWARTKTKHHANVAGILTTSGQNSPLPGHLFLFDPMSFPTNTAPEDVAERLLTAISPVVRTRGGTSFTWKDLIRTTLLKEESTLRRFIHDTTKYIEARRDVLADLLPDLVSPILQAQNYSEFRGSHEQSKTGALAVYKKVFGLPFKATNPGGDGGVDLLNFVMRVDYGVDDPFRPGEKGYTTFHVVVDDDRSQEPVVINGVEVYPPVPYNDALTPDDLHDSDLFRYQCKNWRVRDPYLTAKGEHEGELLKLNDDFGNGLMMLFYDQLLPAAPLDFEETVEALTPERFRRESLLKESPYENGLTGAQEMTYIFHRDRAKKEASRGGIQEFDLITGVLIED